MRGVELGFILKCIARMIGRLSDNGAARLGDFLTWLAFDVLRVRRTRILKNLDIAFGDTKTPKEKLHIGKESVRNFLLTIIEFFRSYDTDISAGIDINGEEHVRACLAENKGVFVFCYHMGNWEAFAARVSKTIAPAHIIVKKVGSDSVNNFVTATRRHNGFIPLLSEYRGHGKQLIAEVFARGEIVAFVMDQARPGAPRIDFFGKPAKTNVAMAALWHKHRVPVMTGYAVRTSIGKHQVQFRPPVNMVDSGDKDADLLTNTALINKEIEAIVRAHPEHYFWMHNRWK